MTRTEKIKQFFEQLPDNANDKDLREAAAKTGNHIDIADVILAYAEARKIDTSKLKELTRAKNHIEQNEQSAVIKTFSDIQPEKINWL
jgi:uncharacterized tellurite resistance protein B-like protein